MFDPQGNGPQYIEDLATAYWHSSALFTAVELGVFNELEDGGLAAPELARRLEIEPEACVRFLNALSALGLVVGDNGASGDNTNGDNNRYFNSSVASQCLVKGTPSYQGDSVLWRKNLSKSWEHLPESLKQGGRIDLPPYAPAESDNNSDMDSMDSKDDIAGRFRHYTLAMDAVVRGKAEEISSMFPSIPPGGSPGGPIKKMLDVGSGGGGMSAAFLNKFPSLSTTLMDMPEVLETARQMMESAGFAGRFNPVPSNALEPWPFKDDSFGLIVLSNIVHAFSHDELQHLLNEAARCLRPKGIVLVHDFFMEHGNQKAALFDLNMLINTYNGMVFKGSDVIRELESRGFNTSGLFPLSGDTAIIAASEDKAAIEGLLLDKVTRLAMEFLGHGFNDVREVDVADVVVADWTRQRCEFGCHRHGSAHCPPNSPTPEETRQVLGDFTRALIMEGEPPTRDFQHLVLKAEREAFKSGFHKAFAYWSGPCTLCDECVTPCRNTNSARPSMEGAGMDVFETVKRAGFMLRPLKDKGDYVKYYALLLIE